LSEPAKKPDADPSGTISGMWGINSLPLVRELLSISIFAAVKTPHMALPEINQKAPHFSAKDQHGNTVSLDDYRGKKVVLYFYPKDDTPGCTAQSCNLRDNYERFRQKGYEIIGVSNDDEKSHTKFAGKYQLPFTLLADTDKKIVHDYGVYGEKTFMGKKYMGISRTTFVIDEQGMIEQVISDVKTKDHTSQILG
jgi:thioredoxin-dependent peroxiredoxin